MSALRFEWDEQKDVENKRKHRISFWEAETVFSDEWALFMEDPEHSVSEDRYLLLGLSSALHLLVVSHCYRREDEMVRIISARRATRRESADYYRRWRP